MSTRSMLLILALITPACGAPQREAESLTDSIRAYNEGIRWQRFEVAASQLPPKERSQFVDDMDARAKDLKISEYDVVKVEPQRGARSAKVQVKVAWYKDSEGTLRETHAIQTWERHGKEWWMVDETRLRGAEMPGLTEPAAHEPGSDPATDGNSHGDGDSATLPPAAVKASVPAEPIR